jgi:hypothetical protein
VYNTKLYRSLQLVVLHVLVLQLGVLQLGVMQLGVLQFGVLYITAGNRGLGRLDCAYLQEF